MLEHPAMKVETRISREGLLATLEIVHRLSRLGVQVISLQEPWTEASGELRLGGGVNFSNSSSFDTNHGRLNEKGLCA